MMWFTGSMANADEDNAIAIDPVNHIIYTEIWGKDDDTTAIIKISYNPTTGVMTSPYNSGTGTLTAGSNVVATYNTTGGKLVDVTAMSFDIATGKLYYIDDDLGYNHNFGANEVWGPTKNIYSIDTTNANPSSTLTQLTTGLTATDANTYIAGFAVDEAKGIIYYGINNVSGHTTQIFWMPITGGAGTGVGLGLGGKPGSADATGQAKPSTPTTPTARPATATRQPRAICIMRAGPSQSLRGEA